MDRYGKKCNSIERDGKTPSPEIERREKRTNIQFEKEC